jgi:hypothetical protein
MNSCSNRSRIGGVDSELWQADGEALADQVHALLSCLRATEARLGTVLVEIADRGVMDLYGYRSVSSWLAEMAGVSRQAADTLVKRAQALNPSRHLDGTVEPALAPATGEAAREGKLSNPTIDAITGTLRRLPGEERERAEAELLALADQAGPAQVAAAGQRIVAHLDPDGAVPDDTDPPLPARELTLRRKRSGTWELRGKFDDETGTRASALLDSLVERRPSPDGREGRFPAGDCADVGSSRFSVGRSTLPSLSGDHGTLPRTSGDRGTLLSLSGGCGNVEIAVDLRSRAERLGDAFSDALDLALNSPELPMQAGERAHVVVAVSLEDLKTGLGKATIGDTGDITAAEARVHACDAMIIPAVLGGKSEPMNLGRLRRLISAGLRRALYLRDRGCTFPGCHRPPRHCQGHHVRHWADQGPTDLGNLTLLCAHHHRLLHRSGWEVRIAPDGLPEFLPPKYLDPRRRPRRNNLHPPLPFAA